MKLRSTVPLLRVGLLAANMLSGSVIAKYLFDPAFQDDEHRFWMTVVVYCQFCCFGLFVLSARPHDT